MKNLATTLKDINDAIKSYDIKGDNIVITHEYKTVTYHSFVEELNLIDADVDEIIDITDKFIFCKEWSKNYDEDLLIFILK